MKLKTYYNPIQDGGWGWAKGSLPVFHLQLLQLALVSQFYKIPRTYLVPVSNY